MAVGTTSDTFPVAGYAGAAQITDALGTSVSSLLFAGTTNGRRFRRLQIWSGAAGSGPVAGSRIVVYFYDGTNNRILDVITCPGGILALQGTVSIPDNFIIVGSTLGFKFQLSVALPSGSTLDLVANGEDF
jgi:hypothetical protein